MLLPFRSYGDEVWFSLDVHEFHIESCLRSEVKQTLFVMNWLFSVLCHASENVSRFLFDTIRLLWDFRLFFLPATVGAETTSCAISCLSLRFSCLCQLLMHVKLNYCWKITGICLRSQIYLILVSFNQITSDQTNEMYKENAVYIPLHVLSSL